MTKILDYFISEQKFYNKKDDQIYLYFYYKNNY